MRFYKAQKGFTTVLILVVVVGLIAVGGFLYFSSRRSADTATAPTTSFPMPKGELEVTPFPTGEPLSAEFLRGTEVGQAILSYLGCIDFDCPDALSAVVAHGSDSVAPLLKLLHHGVPPEVAAQLPGDVPTLVRLRVVTALGQLQDPRALDSLVNILEDPNPLVRAAAATALGQFSGEDTALTALIPLLKDADPLVRELAANALKNLGQPEALPALRLALKTEPEEHIRSAIEMAIEALEER